MLGTSWKTSLMGWLLIGGDVIAFISKTLEAQALPNTLFEWVGFGMAMVTGIGMILAKDRDVTGLPKVVPAMLLAIMVMGLASCTHDLNIGKGRVSHLFQVSQGSIDAVSDSRSRLYNCPTPTIDKNNYAATV